MAQALLIGDEQKRALDTLRKLAADRPINMPTLVATLKAPMVKRKHMAQMTRQSVLIPVGYCVTFSIEEGHPIGACRHMSVSLADRGRLPSPEAVWELAKALGFVGGFSECSIWEETLAQGDAINVVQPLALTSASAIQPTIQ